MLKITIIDNETTLTIYLQDRVMDSSVFNIPDSEIEFTLRKLASKLIRDPSEKFQNETIYIDDITETNIPPLNITKTKISFHSQSDNFTAPQIRHVMNWKDREDLPDSARTCSILYLADNHPENIAMITRQKLPPVDIEEGATLNLPANHELLQVMRNRLMKTEGYIAENADRIATTLVSDTHQTLKKIQDNCLGDLPAVMPDELQRRLMLVNEEIARRVKHIQMSAAEINKLVGEYVLHLSICRSVLNDIAAAIYDAAKNYYFSRWAAHLGNIKELQRERIEFNELFNDIAYIRDDFTIAPEETIKEIIENLQYQDINNLQAMLTSLLQRAYNLENRSAFHFIEKRFAFFDNLYVKPVTRYRFEFTKAFLHEHKIYEQAKKAFDDFPASTYSSGLRYTYKLIWEAEDFIQTMSLAIQKSFSNILQPRGLAQIEADIKPQQQKNGFLYRHKATFISVGVGILVATGVGLAIGFTMPVILPALIAGIGILISSFIIGMVIDSERMTTKESISRLKTTKYKSTHADINQMLASLNQQQIDTLIEAVSIPLLPDQLTLEPMHKAPHTEVTQTTQTSPSRKYTGR